MSKKKGQQHNSGVPFTMIITYQRTVAINPFTVVNPDCNIRKKFFGFNADIKTAFQKGAMQVDQSACLTSSKPRALASRT